MQVSCSNTGRLYRHLVLGKYKLQNGLPVEAEHASEVLQIIYSDVGGPMYISSIDGAKYFVTLTEDFSGYNAVYFL